MMPDNVILNNFAEAQCNFVFLCFICYTTLQRRWQTLTAAVDTWPKITATTTTTVTTRATTTITTTISGSTWRPPFLSVCWSFNFCRADLQLQSLLTHTPYTTPHIYAPEQGRRGRGGHPYLCGHPLLSKPKT